MYLTVGHFKFNANNIKRAEEVMQDIVNLGRAEEGIHQYTFYANPDIEHGYFLFEEWESKAMHDVHFESAAMQAIVPEFFELLAEPPKVSYFDATLESQL
ncbi:MAG: hypothetical protein GKR93_03075 [Gammaproteobacteria bacterium]|nr:hypothetical protein [Gammaproteobacteria bacterium]